MPFHMTHLHIAKNIYKHLPEAIRDLPQFNDIIFAEELEKLKENILYNWYKDKEHQDISSNKLVTIESTMNFVENATSFIVNKIINLV